MVSTHEDPPLPLPSNARTGAGTIIRGEHSFKRFHSRREPGLIVGAGCVIEDTTFAVGTEGVLKIGDHCHFKNAVLLCELEVVIGNDVYIGWNATLTDADFHPVDPGARMTDAMALSPLGNKRARPHFECARIVIEDDVYVGPMAAILKGVRIGTGSWVEPGAVITRDVPAYSRVMGNPARVVEQPRDDSGT